MKRTLLFTALLGLVCAGFASCDDSDEAVTPPSHVEQIKMIGNWKILSWTENGQDDPKRVGEIWVIAKRDVAVGINAPVSYTYEEGIMRFGTRAYRVDFDGRLTLTAADDLGARRVVFEETDEKPDRPEPEPDPEPDPEPEPDPFVAIEREAFTGVWSVAAHTLSGAPDADGKGQLWIIAEHTIRVGVRGDEEFYEYCNTTHNLLTFRGREYALAMEAEPRALLLAATDPAAPETFRFEPAEMPAMYTALPEGAGAYKDTYLTLTFESAPTLGREGEIRIFRADGTQVDRIDMAEVAAERVRMEKQMPITTTMDVIGPKSLKRYRIVHYDPVVVEGNTVRIKPHYDVLDYDTEYYVTVDDGAILATDFSGITPDDDWRFTTKSRPQSTSVTVGSEGTDFRTVQAALDYAYDCGKNTPVEIDIRNGIYEEQLFMRYNNNVTLRGESREGVVIRYDNCDLMNGGVGGSTSVAGNEADKPRMGDAIPYTGGRCVMLIESSDNVRFENLTLQNTHGPGSQAEALYDNDNSGNCRVIFVRCNILSNQDTLNLKGYSWFYDCLVAGDVDFIWGGVDTALFESCEIRAENGGYVVQARCASGKKGFVFLDCALTAAPGLSESMYLARTGGSSSSDNVSWINCRMGTHIPAVGWYGTMNPAAADAANGWKEYGSMNASGGALDLSGRLAGTYVLTEAEYEAGYKDRTTIFAGCSKGLDWLVP